MVHYYMVIGLNIGDYRNMLCFVAHRGPVRGVITDALNQLTITAGADSQLHFWRFKSKQLLDTITMESQIAFLHLHRERSVT